MVVCVLIRGYSLSSLFIFLLIIIVLALRQGVAKTGLELLSV